VGYSPSGQPGQILTDSRAFMRRHAWAADHARRDDRRAPRRARPLHPHQTRRRTRGEGARLRRARPVGVVVPPGWGPGPHAGAAGGPEGAQGEPSGFPRRRSRHPGACRPGALSVSRGHARCLGAGPPAAPSPDGEMEGNGGPMRPSTLGCSGGATRSRPDGADPAVRNERRGLRSRGRERGPVSPPLVAQGARLPVR